MFLFREFGILGNLHLTYGSSPLADRAYDVSADNTNAACKPSSPVAEQKAGMHARHAAWKSKSKGSGRSCACQAIEFHWRAAAKYCRYLDKQVLAGVQFLTARLGWAPLHTPLQHWLQAGKRKNVQNGVVHKIPFPIKAQGLYLHWGNHLKSHDSRLSGVTTAGVF